MNPRFLHPKILSWYKKNRRGLPWRTTRDPYRILLSEIMAQQTQVSRVALFYSSWLKKFPTISHLAKASKADVLRQWSGLGYNSRALRLHALAKQLAATSKGRLPRTVEELCDLPGVGRYTAHAVACFAFGASVPVVDVNIRRIFSRVFWKVRSSTDIKPEDTVWSIAQAYLPKKDVAEWNQALMDLGALVCTARNPRCGTCPVTTACKSSHARAFTKKTPSVKKPEPSFKGIPRRIYRGRILKALHEEPLTPRRLAERVVHQFHPDDLRWLTELLKTMERETLIAIRGNGEKKTVCIAQ
ncbi:MAG TPA: A/G-specific adenine glycosylase [Bacteroidota bacterium]|nr:A/G-specific adenine glycosylase [Bacteroidota bacterium]